MATAKLYNMARMTTATTGTGTITLGSAVSGFISFATAGVADADVVTYAIEDGANREIGRGTYTAAGTLLARTTVLKSTNAGAAINLSGTAQVFICDAAEDHIAGPSASVDSEIALFSGTGGATLKRATQTGILKGASGVIGTATAGTDYLAPPSGTSILKGNSGGALANAAAGTDYVAPSGALGTPSSGTLTNCTGLPAAGLVASTSQAVGFGSIELGNASDTTLSRSSAGVLAVEGVTVSLNSTSSVHTASTIELGNASDTTLSRASAGVLAIEGVSLYPNIPLLSKSAAYTVVLGDANTAIFHPSADTTARTFTIDSNANVAYPVGTTLTFINQASAGVLTIAITTDTMRLSSAGTTGSRTLAANGIATAVKLTSTEWIINGTGLT